MGGKLAFGVSFIPPSSSSSIHSFIHSLTGSFSNDSGDSYVPHSSGCLSFFIRFSLSQEFVAKTPLDTLGPDHLESL